MRGGVTERKTKITDVKACKGAEEVLRDLEVRMRFGLSWLPRRDA